MRQPPITLARAALAPNEVSFSPEHGEIYLLLDSLISKRRLSGQECAEQGHDLASKGFAHCFEVDMRRVISVGAVCRVCEKPVVVSDEYDPRRIREPHLVVRAERDIVLELKKKLRAVDRNRKEAHGSQA